jgi:NAD(P)H dehydrogenase (quinone)
VSKALVLYDSESGNTEKMARFVAEGIATVEGVECRLRSADEVSIEDFLWCDGLAVGSPTNMGTISWKLKKCFDETLGPAWAKVDGKLACAFSSQGGWGGGAELTCQTITNILINFGCLVFGVTDYVDKSHTLHYGSTIVKEPREDHAIKSCQKLGSRLAEWLSFYVDNKKENHPIKLRKSIYPEE